MNRYIVLVALPEGRAPEDIPLPHGSFYAATGVNLEVLERVDGISEACARKLMRRLQQEMCVHEWRPSADGSVCARCQASDR